MDLATIVPSARTVDIKIPGTQKNIGLRFTILSVLDDRMISVRRQLLDLGLQRSQRGKPLTSIDVEANEIKVLSEGITGWEWTEDDDGQPGNIGGKQPEFDKRVLGEILRKYPWMRSQLSEAMDDEKSFFQE